MMADDLVVGEMRVAAEAAMNNAYCRYSKFRVGAAVLSDDVQIFPGCNVENASYDLTMCAERNALFQAMAEGVRKITATSIGNPTDITTPTSVCSYLVIH